MHFLPPDDETTIIVHRNSQGVCHHTGTTLTRIAEFIAPIEVPDTI